MNEQSRLSLESSPDGKTVYIVINNPTGTLSTTSVISGLLALIEELSKPEVEHV